MQASTEPWPPADERLARHYRRLLLAYSGRYRRRHGTEMITTMLAMAAPGRARPSAGEAWHLIASGVRQRFRPPSGRPVAVVAAVLTAVVLGAFGAAAGSWLGRQTFADLPSRAGALTLMGPAVADPATEASFVVRHRQAGRADVESISVPPRAQRPSGTPTWTAEEARDGLAAAGWKILEFTIRPGPSTTCTKHDDLSPPVTSCVDSRTATLIARRDGLILYGNASDAIGGEPGQVWVGGVDGTMFAARSPAYLPLTVAGLLLGALAGWLLSAALAYRIRALPAVVAGAALALAILPVWAITLQAVLLGEHFTDVGPVYMLQPGSTFEGLPPWLIPGCALAAAALAVGLLARRTDRQEPPNATTA